MCSSIQQSIWNWVVASIARSFEMPLLVVNGHTDSVYLINVSIYDVIAIFAMRVVIKFGLGIWWSVYMGILICHLELLSTITLNLESVELVVSDLA